MNDFEKTFDNLAKQYDPNTIFNEFLDYSIDINIMSLQNRNLDFKGREKHYFEMFKSWIELTNNELNKTTSPQNVNEGNGWYDYLGIFYEAIVQTKFKAGARGQFFTPANVCELMVQLCLMGKDADNNNNIVNDCCCGSGRFLLAAHKYFPNSIMIGGDLDEVACKMTVLNMYIHGVTGSVLHKNTLTGEFFGGWRINKYLHYGFPIPHIELINSEWEAYRFIDLNGNDNQVDLDDGNVIDLSIPTETVQSKLM